MRCLNFVFLVAFFLSLANCKSEKPQTQNLNTLIKSKKGQEIDSLLTPYIQELRQITDNNAGLAIGITKGEQIIYAKTLGYENIEQGIEADFNTLFHIASVSKPFTAAAIVKLVEQEKVSIEDKIIDYLPEFTMKGDGYQSITIQHILNHTSGIPRHISENDWLNPKKLDVNLELVKEFELDFEPGSQFSYSNSAFDILGVLISRVSGMPFTEYVSKNILEPAGMTQSTYHKTLNELPENWAVPYSYGLETQEWTPYPHAENFTPSSGLQTTIMDMCQWGILHVKKGAYQDYTLLERENFDLLTKYQYDTPWGDKIGLSWFLQSYMNRPILMHQGSDTGFESIMYVYPEEGISITVMANRDFARTGRIINAASEILFNEKPKNYTISAKYKFAQAYNEKGINEAKILWEDMRQDTVDIYYVNNDDILTTGAVLENGKRWQETKEILEYYNTFDSQSTYAWRLLGNAHLNLKDTTSAISCYEKTLEINPNYEKGRIALDALLGTKK